MPLLADDEVAQLRTILAALTRDVTLVHYTQAESKLFVPGMIPCPSCRDTQELLEELVAAGDRLTLEVHDFVSEAAAADAAGVERIPATVVESGDSAGRVRFFGLPAGYEFASLIEDVVDLGTGAVELEPATLTALAGLQAKVHIQVFFTPT